jgi:hypothetical protein
VIRRFPESHRANPVWGPMQSHTPIVRLGPSLNSFFITPRAVLQLTFPRLTMTLTSVRRPCTSKVPQLFFALAGATSPTAESISSAATKIGRTAAIPNELGWSSTLEA